MFQVEIARSLVESHEITVTAPGHGSVTTRVQLRAGRLSNAQVSLAPTTE
jgi:hypothetical protein